MIARLYPVFLAAPAALAVLGVIAAISMLGAALAALAQDDIKRVLAYSTISQLAYMAGGLAVGARDGAVFHLVVHGSYKALLFLGAGCVVVAVGSNSLAAMGGLRLAMPVTFWSMTAGFAALAGIPPVSGFFSKDVILGQAWHAARHAGRIPTWTGWLVLAAGLVTASVTAAYATRTWLVMFFGERRSPATTRSVPRLMRRPVAALAVPTLILGFAGFGGDRLHPGMSLVSLVFVLAGGGAVFLVWNRDPALDPVRLLGSARPLLRDGFRLDGVYAGVVQPVLALARLVAAADRRIVGAAARNTGRGAIHLGGLLRRTQNGNPQTYVSSVLAGVVIIVLAVVVLT
jgi:NADH-quinone oxidoreductase subunit L